MTSPLSTSILDLLFGAQQSTLSNNRCTLEGVTMSAKDKDVLEFGVAKLEGAMLDFAWGAFRLKIERVVVHDIKGNVQRAGDAHVIEAQTIEFSGLHLAGPLLVPPRTEQIDGSLRERTSAAPLSEEWRLEPLAGAEGSIQGNIKDAHLLFDAEVTIPIRHGRIDFEDATVEHVGPDSRMGVSRMGVYVDAPNGRSYVYQFASAPIRGVEFEQRGALLGPWISERGKLELQPFAEALLGQTGSPPKQGLTEQARLLLGRTSLSGEVRLGAGMLATPSGGTHAQVRLDASTPVRLHSTAVGAGLQVDMASLIAREVMVASAGLHLQCDEISGQVRLDIASGGKQPSFVLDMPSLKLSKPRFD